MSLVRALIGGYSQVDAAIDAFLEVTSFKKLQVCWRTHMRNRLSSTHENRAIVEQSEQHSAASTRTTCPSRS